jgi:hypothetical protein
VRYQYGGLQLGGEVGVAKQDRVFAIEEPASGYGLLKLFTSYSFNAGGSSTSFRRWAAISSCTTT